MTCLACGYYKLSPYLTINNAPFSVEKLPIKKIISAKKTKLRLYQCQKCTLVQTTKEQFLESSDDDFLMSRSYSNFANNYQEDLARSFIHKFSLQGKTIVDVGCGDGFFTSCLDNEGAKVLGIEPGKRAASLARQRGIKIIEQSVDDNFFLKERFSAFSVCQVLEHLFDPLNFLKNVRKFLLPDAVGLIEVPSLIKTERDDRFYDFFPDHTSYYSPTSLSYLLSLVDFDVVEMKQMAGEEYLVAYIRAKDHKNRQSSFNQYTKQFRSFFRKIQNKKIVLWGAGAKGVSLISITNVNKKNILYCIDSDPNKQGKFLNGNIPIVAPKFLQIDRPEIVIITAMMYMNEIIDLLTQKYKFKETEIAVIAPTLKFLK